MQERLNKHMSKTSIELILDSYSLGTPLRWARAEAAALLAEGHRPEHETLQNHVDMADIAVLLADRKTRDNMRKPELVSKLRSLQEYGVQCPPSMQDFLFFRHCDMLVADFSIESVKSYMLAILPWKGSDASVEDMAPDEAATIGSSEGFNALSPKLSDMHGTEAQRAEKFKGRLFSWLITGLGLGAEGKDQLEAAIRWVWQFLEENMNDDEQPEYDDAVDFFVKGSQALMQLLVPTDLKVKRACEEVLPPGAKKRKNSDLGIDPNFISLSTAVGKNPFYQSLLQAFLLYKNKLAERIPELQDLMTTAKSHPAGSIDQASCMQGALSFLSRLEAGVPEDLSVGFRKELSSMALEMAGGVQDNLRAMEGSVEEKKIVATTWVQLVTKCMEVMAKCMEVMARSRPALHKVMQGILDLMGQWNSVTIGSALSSTLADLAAKDVLDIADLQQVCGRVGDFLAQLDADDDERFKSDAGLLVILNKVIAGNDALALPTNAAKLLGAMQILMKGIKAPPPAGAKNLIVFIELWPQLHSSLASWEGLADDIQDRRALDPNDCVLKALLLNKARGEVAARRLERSLRRALEGLDGDNHGEPHHRDGGVHQQRARDLELLARQPHEPGVRHDEGLPLVRQRPPQAHLRPARREGQGHIVQGRRCRARARHPCSWTL